jgi:NAD(P)-dependent dehydrogenase (short-subunit alcohol dehydrogenase family)
MIFDGHVVLVTGGAGRLGRGIAAAFAREGAAVVIGDLKPALVGLRGFAVAGDVADPAQAEAMVEQAEALAGPVTVLVNAHGIIPTLRFMDMTAEAWDEVFAINVRGTMLMCQAVARRWMARNVPGSIVNISSSASRAARPGRTHYSCAKAAVNMLTEALAIELGPNRIRVNAVAPAMVLDRVYTEADPGARPYTRFVVQGTPLGRTGSPGDVAEAVLFLASDKSGWTTGTVLDVTGGAHVARRAQAPVEG